MHDQLGQRGVETAIRKRKPLGDPALYDDLGKALADRRDEGGGRIYRRDSAAGRPLQKLRGQRPGPAADVQYPLTSRHTGQIRELHSQRLREAAHEPGVGICADVKCHDARVVGHARNTAYRKSLKKIRDPVSDRGRVVRGRRERSPARGATNHGS